MQDQGVIKLVSPEASPEADRWLSSVSSCDFPSVHIFVQIFSYKDSSHIIPNDLFLCNYLCKDCISKSSYILRYCELGL